MVHETCLERTDVFVLAGGLGTRIRAVLGDVPKLLAPIGGRPYLYYLLKWLHSFGAKRVVLGLGHRAAAVIDYLQKNSNWGLVVETIVEPEPLGTAGAIRFARHKLRTDPVIVMNGDSFADADLCMLLSEHLSKTSLGTLLCVQADEPGRYGRIVLGNDNRIRGFIEKDEAHAAPGIISAGIYVFSSALLDIIANSAAVSVEREIFAQLPAGSLLAFGGRFPFLDIGTPESFVSAANLLQQIDSYANKDE